MDKQARRAAAAAYKERPLDWGVYAVRCSASGQVWVGATRNLSTYQNRLTFSLRMGGCTAKDLQAAWTAAGAEAFAFETLEQLPPDTGEFERQRILKERTDHWRQRLSALPL